MIKTTHPFTISMAAGIKIVNPDVTIFENKCELKVSVAIKREGSPALDKIASYELAQVLRDFLEKYNSAPPAEEN